jgi:hypothetical protein
MHPGLGTRDKLIDWLSELLGRPGGSWSVSQRAFLDSLLEGDEGTKTLAELAVATARIRASGLQAAQMGRLRDVHEAIEEFWNNPSAETYEELHATGKILNSDS